MIINGLDHIKQDVSVLVCTLNNEKDIKQMLSTIYSQVEQIIVADGSSYDNTILYAKEYNANIVITEPGFANQVSAGLKIVKHKYLFVLECDHRYPELFAEKFIQEFESNDYFVMQASLECKLTNNFFEKGINLFYQIHQLHKGLKNTTGGPSIAYASKYIKYSDIDGFNGYSVDTQRAESWKNYELKQGLGYTIAYQYQELDFNTFFKKYFNYGKGDCDFYASNKKNWTFKRKFKSIFHIFNRYIIDYPIKSFKVGKPYIAVPYLWLSAIVRYSGWIYSVFKNKN